MWAELHVALRERIGQDASPSAAVLNSQSANRQKMGRQDDKVGTTPANG
jgi:hypothetical protein